MNTSLFTINGSKTEKRKQTAKIVNYYNRNPIQPTGGDLSLGFINILIWTERLYQHYTRQVPTPFFIACRFPFICSSPFFVIHRAFFIASLLCDLDAYITSYTTLNINRIIEQKCHSPGYSGRVTCYPVLDAAAVVGVTGELPGIVDLLVSLGDGLAQVSVAAESDVEPATSTTR